jgi:hypothetical protein
LCGISVERGEWKEGERRGCKRRCEGRGRQLDPEELIDSFANALNRHVQFM